MSRASVGRPSFNSRNAVICRYEILVALAFDLCDSLMVPDGGVMRLREERATIGTGTVFVALRQSQTAYGGHVCLVYRIVKNQARV
jgi:hypothetical protein